MDIRDSDPQDVIEAPGYVAPADDPVDPEITDPAHPDYVEPCAFATRPLTVEA